MNSMREELYVGDALLIADAQNDFLPSGALGIKGGDEIVPILMAYMTRFHSLQDLARTVDRFVP